MTKQYDIIEDSYKNARLCNECGRRIKGGDSEFNRHVSTHTGLPYPQTAHNTLNPRRADSIRAEERSKAEHHDPRDLDLVRKMAKSTPKFVRRTGGVFRDGPLRGVGRVQGMPRYFGQTGTIKEACRWIIREEKAKWEEPAKPPTDTPENEPPRRRQPSRNAKRNMQVEVLRPESYSNYVFDRDPDKPDEFVEVITNLWTPEKWKDWRANDPTLIDRKDLEIQQCELCDNPNACQCYQTYVRTEKPDIMPTPKMGDGVQSTAKYKKGECLGELTGEIVPPNYRKDGWVFDLVRHDILGKDHRPTLVCQIHARHRGNWVRKVNHSCDANTMFCTMAISGRWRVTLEATRAIQPGEAITVNYGKKYWENAEGSGGCLCGGRNCISGQNGDKN